MDCNLKDNKMIFTPKGTSDKFNVRPDTLDEFVVKECYRGSYFNHIMDYQPDDIVLDVGCNIAAYSIRVASIVKHVYAYEANQENFNIANGNIDMNERNNISLFHCALTGSSVDEVTFYLNKGKNKGLHSLVTKGGRDSETVPAKRFSEALRESGATKVKMDIEGGEWDIFTNDDIDWSGVKSFVFEWHHKILGEKFVTPKRDQIREYLKLHFDNVDMPTKITWDCLAYAWND